MRETGDLRASEQLWVITHVGGDSYTIENSESHIFMELRGGRSALLRLALRYLNCCYKVISWQTACELLVVPRIPVQTKGGSSFALARTMAMCKFLFS